VKTKKKEISLKSVRKYKLMLIGLVFFNIIDAISTYYFVVMGGAEELNPIMDYLLGVNPELFIVLKIILMFVFAGLFWKFLPHSKMARIATVGCFVPYSLLAIYYVVGWIYLGYHGML